MEPMSRLVPRKKALHYHLFLASIKVSDEITSAAGIPGFQNFTPALDAEWIMYGRHITNFPPECSLNLHTGAASPALGVRALLEDFAKQGTPIHIHVYDLGCGAFPHFDPSLAAEGWTLHYDYFRNRHSAPVWDLSREDYCLHPMDQIQTSLAAKVFLDVYAKNSKDRHILAECVPNGTTTAAALWNATKPMDGELQWPGGSSMDDLVLKARQKVMERLTARALHRRPHIGLTPALWPKHERVSLGSEIMDPFQDTLCAILELSGKMGFEFESGTRIWLGGGVQMLAPLLWVTRTQPHTNSFIRRHFQLTTTRWVGKFFSRPGYGGDNFDYWTFEQAYAQGKYSLRKEWQLYDEGHSKEGLGFGALIRLWEENLFEEFRQGLRSDRNYHELWHVLDAALPEVSYA